MQNYVNPNKQVTITLDYPVKELTTLTLRRPTVRDFMLRDDATGTERSKDIAMLARLTETPPDSLEDLDFGDYNRLQEALADFLTEKPKGPA
jgi:hypothetical protein